MNKTYSIELSPLFRMRNRKKLAKLLNLPENYFKKQHQYEYHEFSKLKSNGKDLRYYAVPEEELKRIQKRICKLLSRIETPDWVMMGKKHCSYINNAEKHKDKAFVKTMDISQFYDSTKGSQIYRMFVDVFLMSHDIAWIMTSLVSYNNKLPTGSPSSQLIVYWTFSGMFENIHTIAEQHGCDFSLYVDDMTFSSNKPIKSELRENVAIQLRMNGLKAKIQKDHYYQADKMKEVTGVGLKDGKILVLNRRRQKILMQYEKCKKDNDIYEIEKLNGMLCSMRQIEPNIFPEIANYIKHYEVELKKLARNRYYREVRHNKKGRQENLNARTSNSRMERSMAR